MAYKNTDWDEVIGLANARIGKNLTGSDLTRMGFLINSGAKYIYDENRYWPRFLVLEPRTVARGYIATEEDSYNVYGAGTTEANGLYVRNGNSVDGNPRYSLYAEDGTKTHDIESIGNVAWAILNLVTTEILYSISSSSTTPPETGWTVANDGEALAPIVQALSDINEYIGHWDGAKWVGGDPNSMEAYAEQNGIRVTYPQDGTVYVAYKKENDVTYGDGEGGTTSDIPREWSEYMSITAARAYRASQAQPDGFNPIALKDVSDVLYQALIKVGKQGCYDTIAHQFKTRYGMDVTVR